MLGSRRKGGSGERVGERGHVGERALWREGRAGEVVLCVGRSAVATKGVLRHLHRRQPEPDCRSPERERERETFITELGEGRKRQ